jgi:CRP-like cAMP-binding protein
VGEQAVLKRTKRGATARAVTQAELLIVPAHEIPMLPALVREFLDRKVRA